MALGWESGQTWKTPAVGTSKGAEREGREWTPEQVTESSDALVAGGLETGFAGQQKSRAGGECPLRCSEVLADEPGPAVSAGQ